MTESDTRRRKPVRRRAPVRGDARRLAEAHAPAAIARLARIMEGEDDRLAAAACNAILERAYGKPSAQPGEEEGPLEIVVRWQGG